MLLQIWLALRLPLESKPLQALVSEPVKPIIDTVVMSNAVHAYVSQSDKGELLLVLEQMIMFLIHKKEVIKLLKELSMQY